MRSSSSIRRLIGAALVALTLGGCAEALSDQQDDAATTQHQLRQVTITPTFSSAQARTFAALGLTELRLLALDGQGQEIVYYINAAGHFSLTPDDPSAAPQITLPDSGRYLMSLHAQPVPEGDEVATQEEQGQAEDASGLPGLDGRLADGGINEGPQPIPFDPNDPGNKHDASAFEGSGDPAVRRVVSLSQPHPEGPHRGGGELDLKPGQHRFDFVIDLGAVVR